MFKNEFKITNELVPEYILGHLRCKKMTPAYVLLFGVLFAACIFVLAFDVITGSLSVKDWGYAAIPVIFCFVFYANINNDIRRERNKLVSMGEGLKPVTHIISKDGIEVINSVSPTPKKIPVKQIKKVLMTKNLFILDVGNNMVLPLKKGSFENASDEQFIEFMKTKCKFIGK